MQPVDDLTRFICLFHDGARARSAVSALENAGIARSEINVIDGGDGASGVTSAEGLASLGVPDGDVDHLEDGLRHGGVLLSLRASEDRSAEIERIFRRFNADKIDEAELRTEDTHAGAIAPRADSRAAVSGETVIPVAEEQFKVGTREVERGGVRVFRRTVEEPVSQTVDLHGERVVLGYREVNRPATENDLNAGSQEIELIETAEVPVVQKVARVVEEVHVGKVETDRTEVVSGTVRHTEIEVEPVAEVDDRTSTTPVRNSNL